MVCHHFHAEENTPNISFIIFFEGLSITANQLGCTCRKSAVETPVQCVKSDHS